MSAEGTRVRMVGGPADGEIYVVHGYPQHIVIPVSPPLWSYGIDPYVTAELERVTYTYRGRTPEGEPVFTP